MSGSSISGNSLGTVPITLVDIINAALYETPHALVRVSDEWKSLRGSNRGQLRVIMYLEDLGEGTHGNYCDEPSAH